MSAPTFRPPSTVLTTIGLSLATFMQVLDTTIANVSLPALAGDLAVSPNQATWVITSFAVCLAITLPLTGWLSRRFGEVPVFIASTLMFTISSFLCGLAPNMPTLIAFRALQGAVAGPMYPLTQSLLISIYPSEKRGMALALLAMVTVVAPICGPILGGWITDNYNWPWIFFINVPIGLFACFIVSTQMMGRAKNTIKAKIDYVGLIALIIGVGAFQIVLDKGNDEDWFESTFIIITSLISVIGIAVFLIWELTEKDPIVNLRLFRHRNFSAGTIALVVAYAAFFGIGLLVPQWLQRQIGYTSTWAGFATAPIGLIPVILSPFVGKYANRFDLRVLASAAFLVMGGTCMLRAGFNLEVDFYHVAGVQLLQGLGVALFFMPVTQILLSDLTPAEIADGSGLATFLRTLGGSFSASLVTFLWQRRAELHHAQLSEHISAYDPISQQAITALGHGNDQVAYAMLERTLVIQGYQISFNDVMYLLGWMFFALVVIIWFAKPPFGAKAGPAAAGAH